jgi:hypothetical protein
MMPRRMPLLAALAAAAALIGAAPAAGQTPWPTAVPPVGGVPFGGPGINNTSIPGPCGTSSSAGACVGAGLSFIGPSVGQIASVIGPTIISPAVVGNNIAVSAGDAAVGP